MEKTVVVKVLDNLTDSLREHEEEYRVLKDLSRHRNLPEFLGAYVQHDPDVKQDQLWFVMEVSTRISYSLHALNPVSLTLSYFLNVYAIVCCCLYQ